MLTIAARKGRKEHPAVPPVVRGRTAAILQHTRIPARTNTVFRGYPFLPFILIAPEMIVVFVFFIWPALQGLYQSLLIQDAFGLSVKFVGLHNFSIIFRDRLYLQALLTSVRLAAWVITLSMTAGLLLAVATNGLRKAKRVYQTLLIWPYALAPVVAGVVFYFLFNPTVGVLSNALKSVGIPWNHTLRTGQAFALVTAAASWKRIAYNFLFFLAGLSSVPTSLVEAASIDGASAFLKFRRIVFPLLSPTTFFLLTMNAVYSFFDTFAVVHQITYGGPNHATTTLVYKVYKDGFLGLDLGGSAAQSVILMTIVISLTVLQFKFMEKRIHYG